eukprot:10062731-Lingulodinium_polyedra.AAC.1
MDSQRRHRVSIGAPAPGIPIDSRGEGALLRASEQVSYGQSASTPIGHRSPGPRDPYGQSASTQRRLCMGYAWAMRGLCMGY